MKKKSFVLGLSFVLFGIANAQVSNGGFETNASVQSPISIINWKSGHYSASPIYDKGDLGIQIFNLFSFRGSLISDTNTIDFDQAKCFLINGRPDSLYVWINFDITFGDTLLIRTKNRENQNPFGYGELKLTGKELTKKRYGLKIDYVAPGFANSEVLEFNLKVRSQLRNSKVSIFKVELATALGASIPTPNSDLSDWVSGNLETIAAWTTVSSFSALTGNMLEVSTETIVSDASEGKQALKVKNVHLNGYTLGGSALAIDVIPFLDCKGSIVWPNPMFAVPKSYAGLTLDYKYNTTNDRGIISLAMFKNGLRVAKTDCKLVEIGSNFSQASIILDFGSFKGIPASIFIYASKEALNPIAGPELIVDNLVFNEVNNISNKLSSFIKMYPNPAAYELNVYSTEGKINEVVIAYLQGIKLIEVNSHFNEISLASLSTGAYLVPVNINGINYNQKILKL